MTPSRHQPLYSSTPSPLVPSPSNQHQLFRLNIHVECGLGPYCTALHILIAFFNGGIYIKINFYRQYLAQACFLRAFSKSRKKIVVKSIFGQVSLHSNYDFNEDRFSKLFLGLFYSNFENRNNLCHKRAQRANFENRAPQKSQQRCRKGVHRNGCFIFCWYYSKVV